MRQVLFTPSSRSSKVWLVGPGWLLGPGDSIGGSVGRRWLMASVGDAVYYRQLVEVIEKYIPALPR